jgi:hypothetical protein
MASRALAESRGCSFAMKAGDEIGIFNTASPMSLITIDYLLRKRPT